MIWVSNNSFYVTFWHVSGRTGVAPHLSHCFSFTVFKLWSSMRFILCRNVILNYFFLLMNCFFEDGGKEPVQVCCINVIVINVFFLYFCFIPYFTQFYNVQKCYQEQLLFNYSLCSSELGTLIWDEFMKHEDFLL